MKQSVRVNVVKGVAEDGDDGGVEAMIDSIQEPLAQREALAMMRRTRGEEC